MAFQQNGSGFTNLKKVVDANQDNKLGSTIQSGVTNQADATKSSLNNAFGQFQNNVNSNAVDTDANRQQVQSTVNKFSSGNDNQQINLGKGGFDEHAAQPGQPTTPGPYGAPVSALSTGSSPASGNQVSTQSSSDTQPPVTFGPQASLNGGDVSAFQKFRSGTYAGPTQINNIGDIQNQARDVQQLGQSVNNSGGRQSLLQRFIGGNQYTQGQQNLDNLLLGATGGANLQAAQQDTRGIVNQVNQADSNARALANQTASQNRSFADYTNQSIANAYDPQNAQLNDNLKNTQDAESAREAKVKALTDMLSKDNNPDTAKAAIKQLGDMGLINTNNSQTDAQKNMDPTSGLTWEQGTGQSRYFPVKIFRDKDGEYVNEVEPGKLIYSGGPNNGKEYHPPGWNQGSELDQWTNMITNLSKYNEKAPEQVNYNTILQQAIQDNQAQNISRSGVANQNQASRLNALNQLAGRSQEFADPTAVGNYQGGSQGFNQDQALKAIRAITDPKGLAADEAAAAKHDPGLIGNAINNSHNAIGDLAQGNIGQASKDFLGGSLNSIGLNSAGNTIGNVSTGVQNKVDELFNSGGGGGGRWFCTELYRRRLCTISEVFGMSKFFLRNIFTATKGLLFYAENGERIVKVANQHGFNWAAEKPQLVDRVLELTAKGEHKAAMIHYGKMIQGMCLRFEETKHLYHADLWNTSWFEMVVLLPKLVRTTSFKMACKLFIAGATGRLNVQAKKTKRVKV